jgi:TetR/AcrR family transcriptional repressor of nem operon
MPRATNVDPHRGDARTRLLEAARDVIRAKGYAATTVDDLCREARVTKGAFFHHFESKEALGVAVAEYWTETTTALFGAATYHALQDPLERVLAYIDYRKELITGSFAQFSCLAGTMLQEVFESSPAIREACAESILGHAATLKQDVAEAMRTRRVRAAWTAESLARHTQTVIQGSFVLAKATGDPATAREGLDHLKRYVELLFSGPTKAKGRER